MLTTNNVARQCSVLLMELRFKLCDVFDMENGILTFDERVRLRNLLSKSQKYTFVGLPALVERDAKYFIATKEHLLNIYVHRFKNTNKIKVKSQLAWVVNNLTASLKSNLRVSIIGPEDDRIIIFSDTEMDALLGIVSREDSSSVIEYTYPWFLK